MANKISFIVKFREQTTLLLDTIDTLKGMLQQAEELGYADGSTLTQADIDLTKTSPSMMSTYAVGGDPLMNDPATIEDLLAAMGTMGQIDTVLENEGHYPNLYKIRK